MAEKTAVGISERRKAEAGEEHSRCNCGTQGRWAGEGAGVQLGCCGGEGKDS